MQTGGSLLLPTQRLSHRVVAEASDLVVIPLMQTHTGTVEQIDGGDDLHGAEPFGPPSCSSALQYPRLKHRAREDPGDGGNPFVGKPLVARLRSQGHELTLFTRGKNAIPDGVEHLKGDRGSETRAVQPGWPQL